MKIVKQLGKKKVIAISAVVLLALGGVAVKVSADNQQQKELEQALVEINKDEVSLKDLLSTVKTFRDTDKPSFLAKDIDMKKLASAMEQVEKLTKKTVTYDFVETKKKVKVLVDSAQFTQDLAGVTEYQAGVQTGVNSLFVSKDKQAINGHDIDEGLAVADDLTLETINKVESTTNDLDMYELIPVSSEEKESSWQEAIQALIDNAKKQVETITATTKTIEGFFKDGKPVDTTESKKIEEVEKQLNTIKNEKAKKQLVEKLKPVKDSVAKKAEAKKKEDEASKVVAEQPSSPATGNTNAPVTTTPDYGQGNGDTGTPSYDNSANNNYTNNGGGYGGGATGGASGGSGGGNTGGGNTGGNGGGGNQPSTPSNNGGGGPASQEDLDQQANDASKQDPTQDPNSPWYRP